MKRWHLFFLLFFVESSFAANVCLYSRSNNDIAGGHSFVVVEENNNVIVSYGFWPDSKHAGSIATNKLGDFPFAALKK